MITVLYWGLIFPNANKKGDKCIVCELPNHALPLMSSLFEFSLTRWPLTMRHMCFSTATIIVYVFGVNLTYTISIRKIYTFMNWKNNFGGTLVLMAILFLASLSYNSYSYGSQGSKWKDKVTNNFWTKWNQFDRINSIIDFEFFHLIVLRYKFNLEIVISNKERKKRLKFNYCFIYFSFLKISSKNT